MAKRILVVDDDENILSLERTILEQKGFEVTAAAGGGEALKLLAGQVFDLVLLDVMMPEIDGFTVCRKIKEDPRLKDVPVIFLPQRAEGRPSRRASSQGPSCTSTSRSRPTSCSPSSTRCWSRHTRPRFLRS